MGKKRSRFGTKLDAMMLERGMSQKDLASAIGTSVAYVSAISTGTRAVSPARIDALAEDVGLAEGEVRDLHLAAALDAGFKLDLPDDF